VRGSLMSFAALKCVSFSARAGRQPESSGARWLRAPTRTYESILRRGAPRDLLGSESAGGRSRMVDGALRLERRARDATASHSGDGSEPPIKRSLGPTETTRQRSSDGDIGSALSRPSIVGFMRGIDEPLEPLTSPAMLCVSRTSVCRENFTREQRGFFATSRSPTHDCPAACVLL
jgi:hypothetical protein